MKLPILEIEDKCSGCGACVSICPHQCLRLKADSEGFYYPEFDEQDCLNCGLCEKVCKEVTPSDYHGVKRDYVYIYYTRDEQLREKSTSGGAFTSLANIVLNNNGAVFATRFNADNRRVEVSSTDSYPLDSFRKSKYVESFVGDAFFNIRAVLRDDRQVLFCGTPCQVAGLKQYLNVAKVKTDKLITVDFVCHGVPSMRCFDSFMTFEENRKRRIIDVDFRYKDFNQNKQGWHNMNYCEYYSDGGKKVIGPRDLRYYYYYYPFLENRSLRKCCYMCNQILYSQADVSIGDFWGIAKYSAIKDDNKGLSFLLFNNPSLENVWLQDIKDEFVEKIPFYPNENQYSEKDRIGLRPVRDDFYHRIEKHGYINTVRSLYFHRFIFKWVRRVISFFEK